MGKGTLSRHCRQLVPVSVINQVQGDGDAPDVEFAGKTVRDAGHISQARFRTKFANSWKLSRSKIYSNLILDHLEQVQASNYAT